MPVPRDGPLPAEPQPGTYALVCYSANHIAIEVGRLGRMRMRPGFYVYAGSALGPGGLRGRLGHHLAAARAPRWHIDYLRARARLERIWVSYGPLRREHRWAAALQAMSSHPPPLPGFGSSDCRCASHLFYFDAPPSSGDFAAALRSARITEMVVRIPSS